MDCSEIDYNDLLDLSGTPEFKETYPKFHSALKDFDSSIIGLKNIKYTIYRKLKSIILFDLKWFEDIEKKKKIRQSERIQKKNKKNEHSLRRSLRIELNKNKKRRRKPDTSDEEEDEEYESYDDSMANFISSIVFLAKKQQEDVFDESLEMKSPTQKPQSENVFKPIHIALLGSSGCGKTYLAGKLFELYASLNLFQADGFYALTRGDLIAGYQGQSTAKTRKIIDKARNGVVFVDEAYALVQNRQDSFGSEILTEIIAAMTNPEMRVSFWFAGYKQDMLEKLFAANKGLMRRIDTSLEFQPPTTAELLLILKKLINEDKLFTWNMLDVEEQFLKALLNQHKNQLIGHCDSMRRLYEVLKEHMVQKLWNCPTNCNSRWILIEDVKESFRKLVSKTACTSHAHSMYS